MSDKYNRNQNEIEVNLWDIFNILWGKAWLIILIGLFCALLAFGGAKFLVTPQFTSTTKIYILNQKDETALTQGDMQASTYLTKDYAEMIKSRTVAERVILQVGLDMNSSKILSKISVKIAADARIISISITDEDPFKAAQIANAVREVASEHIRTVMNIEMVNVVEEANVPLVKSSPNVRKLTLFGAAVGTVLPIIIILLIYLTNDTIQISSDIEKKLGINVLSVIPLRDDSEKIRTKLANRRKGRQ